MESDVTTLNREVEREALALKRIEGELRKVIVGQDYLLDRLLVGLLARGHVLIEGVPGLAKTLAVKTLAQTLAIDSQRIQFTPDLLPADLLGTLIWLCSDASRFVNGAIIPVDGGFAAFSGV